MSVHTPSNPASQCELHRDDLAISVRNVSKAYRIWRDPAARLKAPLWEGLKRLVPESIRSLGPALKPRSGNPTGYYKDFYALRNVSFEIRKGESVGILGRNGSGKSTLLQILARTLTATSGSIISHGRISALLELGSGFNPDFTGHENILLNASIMGLSKGEIEERYPDIIDFADISDFIHQPVKTYSSGMAVRLGFSVAIHTNPSILIVDEALAVGDAGFQQKCYSRLNALKAAGTSLLFVTHDVTAVSQLCDKAIVMEKGEIVFNGDTQTAINEYKRLTSHPASPKQAAEAREQKPRSFYYPASPNLHESGDRSAEIVDWRILDENGEITAVLAFNRRYEVHITMVSRKDSINPNVGFFFSDIRGNEIAGSAINHADVHIGRMSVNQKAAVCFSFVNKIRPGEYLLNIGCSETIADRLCAYHRIYSSTLITFEGKVPVTGNHWLDTHITISHPR